MATASEFKNGMRRPIETHSIFIGRVAEVVMQPERAPLVFINGQYAQVPVPTALQSVNS